MTFITIQKIKRTRTKRKQRLMSSYFNLLKNREREKVKHSFFANAICANLMARASVSKPSYSFRLNRSQNETILTNQLINQLLKFRIDGQTINARNVDELYPGLDRLLMRSLQTGDCRQIYNRLKRNLKPEYLLITGKHIHLSVCSQTQQILEKLVETGATLGKFEENFLLISSSIKTN